MKRYIPLALLIVSVSLFSYCNSAKKAAGTPVPTVFYDTDVRSLIEIKCTPCHIPSKGGRKAALNTYETASKNIDDMIRRIQLNPGDKDFMPFKHPKLTESEISVFTKWKAEGMTRTK